MAGNEEIMDPGEYTFGDLRRSVASKTLTNGLIMHTLDLIDKELDAIYAAVHEELAKSPNNDAVTMILREALDMIAIILYSLMDTGVLSKIPLKTYCKEKIRVNDAYWKKMEEANKGGMH